MRGFILFLVLLFNLNSYCQYRTSNEARNAIEFKIDSISDLSSDSTLLDELIKIAKFEGRNNPNITIEWLNEVDTFLKVSRMYSLECQVKVLLAKSHAFIVLEKIDTAYSLSNRALSLCSKQSDSLLIANCYSNLSIIYWKRNQSQEAIEYSTKALRIFERYNKVDEISRLYNIIGIVHQSLSEYEKSIIYYHKALDFAKQINDTTTLSRVYNNLGDVYRIFRKYDDALKYLELSLRIKEKQKDKRGIANSLSNIGGVFYEKGEFNRAIEYSKEALIINNEINNMLGCLSNYQNLARAFFGKMDLNESKKYAYRCIKEGSTISSGLEIEYMAHSLLSQIYESERNYDKALLYLKQSYKLKDSLMGIDKLKAVAELEAKLKTVESIKKIELLEKDRIYSDNELKKSRLIIFSSLLVIVLLIIIVYILYKSRNDLKQKNAIINAQHDELEKYKNRLEDLVDEKSRNLKDALIKAEQSDALKSSFLNNLSHEIRTPMNAVLGILNIINAEKPEELNDELKIINSSFNQLLQMIDDILFLSRLQTDQVVVSNNEFSLMFLMQKIAQELNKKIIDGNKNIKVDLVLHQNVIVLSDYSLVYKMLQQVVDNAVKYTDSGSITIGYELDNASCFAYVKDTGIGIDDIKMNTVFHDFQKANDTNRLFCGLGVGLAIVKKISDLMFIPISLESEKNKGTILKLEFTRFRIDS